MKMSENTMEDSNELTQERVREELRPPERSFFIFGRDISKIPCFRNSLLYGIGGGLGCGLGHFMFTSRPLAACNFAVYSFSAVTLAYWVQCRYNYSKTKHELQKIQELLQQASLQEGRIEENPSSLNGADVKNQ